MNYPPITVTLQAPAHTGEHSIMARDQRILYNFDVHDSQCTSE